ncbi:DNA-binding response regulator [Azospirillum sp. sgz302134]
MDGYGLPARYRGTPACSAPDGNRGGGAARPQNPPGDAGRIAVLLIDDRVLFGESLAMAMNAQASDLAVTHWRSADVLANLPLVLRGPDVVLVCIGRASLSRGSANRLIRALAAEPGHPPVAVLSDAAGRAMVRAGVRIGLRGVVSGLAPLSTVIGALRQIHQGATVIPSLQR